MPVGFVTVPVGIVGPLIFDGRELSGPMATTEGCHMEDLAKRAAEFKFFMKDPDNYETSFHLEKAKKGPKTHEIGHQASIMSVSGIENARVEDPTSILGVKNSSKIPSLAIDADKEACNHHPLEKSCDDSGGLKTLNIQFEVIASPFDKCHFLRGVSTLPLATWLEKIQRDADMIFYGNWEGLKANVVVGTSVVEFWDKKLNMHFFIKCKEPDKYYIRNAIFSLEISISFVTLKLLAFNSCMSGNISMDNERVRAFDDGTIGHGHQVENWLSLSLRPTSSLISALEPSILMVVGGTSTNYDQEQVPLGFLPLERILMVVGGTSTNYDQGVMPPNSTLYYEVELLSFVKDKEPWDMNTLEKMEVAVSLLEQDIKTGPLDQSGLNFVSEIICKSKALMFERMLFHATRGNLFFNQTPADEHIMDPLSSEMVEQIVFFVFFSGLQAKAKILKICEAFGTNCCPVPEDINKRRQITKDASSHLAELEATWDAGLHHRNKVIILIMLYMRPPDDFKVDASSGYIQIGVPQSIIKDAQYVEISASDLIKWDKAKMGYYVGIDMAKGLFLGNSVYWIQFDEEWIVLLHVFKSREEEYGMEFIFVKDSYELMHEYILEKFKLYWLLQYLLLPAGKQSLSVILATKLMTLKYKKDAQDANCHVAIFHVGFVLLLHMQLVGMCLPPQTVEFPQHYLTKQEIAKFGIWLPTTLSRLQTKVILLETTYTCAYFQPKQHKWSAAISVRLISSGLHITDHKQMLEMCLSVTKSTLDALYIMQKSGITQNYQSFLQLYLPYVCVGKAFIILQHEYHIDPEDIKAIISSAIIQLHLNEATELYKGMDNLLRAFGIYIVLNHLVYHLCSNGLQVLNEQSVDVVSFVNFHDIIGDHWLPAHDERSICQGTKRISRRSLALLTLHHCNNKMVQRFSYLRIILKKVILAELQVCKSNLEKLSDSSFLLWLFKLLEPKISFERPQPRVYHVGSRKTLRISS
ncbi:putative hydroxymethylglutaryl-CoA reductase, class I/II [Rosa chinensis]|uniref:V-type proton ATPase subunit a n=1 Tax=Rosa chinensis TaxID=74649 RepID=A0A2P6QQZ6_ROSCH|nr:putative hydroxymethylglutaryl-CoA reductase, class I/II [Rosa chinensis]